MFGALFGGASRRDRRDAVLFQGFGWDSCQKGGWYTKLKQQLPELKAAGVTHLWLPPPSHSVSPQGYMPGQLYNLEASKYGGKKELKELTSAAKKQGIACVADVVINHRCADIQENGVYNHYSDDTDHKGRRIDWGRWAITCDDPHFNGSGNRDTGADYAAAPDLDHANPELRAALRDWLHWLQHDIGFEGWRLDFVKGYAPKFVDEYVSSTVGAAALNVGEFWVDMEWQGGELAADQDRARQVLCDWVNANNKSCSAFDFPLKGVLQEAAKRTQYWRLRDARGKAPGLVGWWPEHAVTFVDNHDTGSSQQHWPFPSHLVGVGYAYILTHPGIPCVFYEHFFDWGEELRGTIKGLLEVRRRAGIKAGARLDIRAAEADFYFAVVDGRVAVKLGPRLDMGPHLPRAEDGWQQVAAGTEFCVWEKKK
ncbi:glycoside hydrolase [Raphidocelis subcapitata]|uniref:alpha-amylase n=1 Tax=Raphidocelis subcapitata TaxID=307507 RepID=A0A2V0P434_9CHLO|nr:glycoside hydrolase [Raphidocelis subcapitata]|eukprot:GBF91845.1 glycoside hydrolase [Raphidocelis subcapitata]